MQITDYTDIDPIDPDFDDMDPDLARLLAGAAWQNAMMAFTDSGLEFAQ